MTKFQNIKKFFALFCILIFAFCIFSKIEAAKLDLTSQIKEIGVAQLFQVDLLLDTEGEEINAIEGKIIFSIDLLELKEIRDGNSIINFWIERPRIEQTGAIGFSGIIPGGYQETKGFLFSVVFQAKASGDGAIKIRDATILLNDGEGTPTSVKLSPFQFSISQETPTAPLMVEIIKDTDLPEDFEPKVASDPNIFDGKYFLVFATQDKGSGIDHYEVCEGSKRKCVIAESPYLLQNQKLDQKIFVKAVDKSGNEREVLLLPQKPKPWYKNYVIFAILIIMGLIIASVILRKILWQKFIKSR